MTFDSGRPRKGEVIAGGGAVLLLVAMFLLPWFAVGPGPADRSLDGWHSLTNIRWVLLMTIALSIALVFSTATRRSPAVPVTLSMIVTVLGGLAVLLVLFRLLDPPGGASVVAQPGLYVGLLATALVAGGGYLSLRGEGSPFGDPASIETVALGGARAGTQGQTERVATGRPVAGSEDPARPDGEGQNLADPPASPETDAPARASGPSARTESSSAGRRDRDVERA